MRRILAVLGPLALAGCAGAPPENFPALNYSYLPPITLNVASVNVVNSYAPDPGAMQLDAEDPAPPADVLASELARRLVPGGSPGTATVTIEAASIDESNGQLAGVMTVRVDVASADGRETGFTEASVTHSEAPADNSDNATRAALYDITKQMMDAMNVQLQYQLQHDLPQWVVGAAPGGFGGGAAPTPGGIQSAPLAAPTAAAAAAASPPAPATATPPAAIHSLVPPGFSPLSAAPAAPSVVPPAVPQTVPPAGTPSGAPQPLVPY